MVQKNNKKQTFVCRLCGSDVIGYGDDAWKAKHLHLAKIHGLKAVVSAFGSHQVTLVPIGRGA